jgi:hypothetical protein
MTAWCLSKSKDFLDPCSHPALLDVTFKDTSPATVALLFLASLLDGSAERLRLLWAPLGCHSFGDFHNNFPRWAGQLRGVVLSCIAWTHRRWRRKFAEFPFVLASLADSRVPLVDRRRIGDRFNDGCDNCISHFGRCIRSKLHDGDSIFDESWSQCLWGWARATSQCLSIADMERSHKRSKVFATSPAMCWANFIATHVNFDTKKLDQTDVVLRSAISNSSIGREKPNQKQQSAGPKRAKSKSAYEVFNAECIADEKSRGLPRELRWAFTSEWHRSVRARLATAKRMLALQLLLTCSDRASLQCASKAACLGSCSSRATLGKHGCLRGS